MTSEVQILVAAESPSVGEALRGLLRDLPNAVAVLPVRSHAPHTFEAQGPFILILGFETLEKSEEFYLGALRKCPSTHEHLHRTVILCKEEDTPRAYELCRKECFDDYFVCWPRILDPLHLPLAVRMAIHVLEGEVGSRGAGQESGAQGSPAPSAVQAGLRQFASQGGQHIGALGRAVQQGQQQVGGVLDALSRKLLEGGLNGLVEVQDSVGIHREFERLKSEEIPKCFQPVTSAVQALDAWIELLPEDFLPPPEDGSSPPAPPEPPRPSILVIDDDPFQHRIVKRQLLGLNIDLRFAASAQEGLAWLHGHRADLVLMDLDMPEMDGLEATRCLKAIPEMAALPVIIFTGHSGQESVMASLDSGAADFIVKPVHKNILQNKIRNYLNLP